MSRMSIAIPTKNRPIDFERTLKSLCMQDYSNFELIVVDQSRDDKSKAVLHRVYNKNQIARQMVKIVYLYRPNLSGLTEARNVAVAAASGEYISFCDDDVTLHRGYLKGVQEAFNNFPEFDVIGGKVIEPYKAIHRRLKQLCASFLLRGPYSNHCSMLAVMQKGKCVPCNGVSGGAMSFRLNVLKREPFDEWFHGYSLGEDMEISFRLRQKGYKLGYACEASLTHYASPCGRDSLKLRFSDRIYNNFRIFRKHLAGDTRNFLAYAIFNIFIMLSCVEQSVNKRSLLPIIGVIAGAFRVGSSIIKRDF